MTSLQISPQAAAKELLARRRARSDLLAYTEYTFPGYQAAEHHRLICEALGRVERRDCRRLMIFAPPRHGKSELCSRRLPAWYLGRNPTHELIAASYNSELASDFGREVRDIVGSDEHQTLFPGCTLKSDDRAANRWRVTDGGAYRAVGVGTAATGRGADLLLIDDPFKDRQEADSETQRRRVWDWYRSTAYTRLSPIGCVVVINTRWHEDDLSGRLLREAEADGEQWEVLDLPALSPDGRALWPERFSEERLAEIKRTLGPREWSALYMQRPQADDGDYFKREWLKTYEQAPPDLSIYGTSDYAVTDGGGDYTVHRVWGIAPDGVIYRLDGWRGQTTSDVWISQKIELMRKWRPLCWYGEGGVIQKAIEPMLLNQMRSKSVYCRIEWVPSVAAKDTRARSFQALAAMGLVRFERDADVSEFVAFPAGRHDDDVDAASLIGRVVDDLRIKRGVASSPRPKEDRYAVRDSVNSDWMLS